MDGENNRREGSVRRRTNDGGSRDPSISILTTRTTSSSTSIHQQQKFSSGNSSGGGDDAASSSTSFNSDLSKQKKSKILNKTTDMNEKEEKETLQKVVSLTTRSKLQQTDQSQYTSTGTTSSSTNSSAIRETVMMTEKQNYSKNVALLLGKKNDINENSNRSADGTVFIAAVAPKKNVRLMALWSQLECFVSDKKIETVIISAPVLIKEKGFLEKFLSLAKESIPHLANTRVIVKYYINDRYDVGLWCDALKDNMESFSKYNFEVVHTFDRFVLINDSIMAIRDNFTDVLDVLQQNSKLSMTSLNYSFLHGSKGEHHSTGQKLWLESVFRAFNRNGMERYMNYACVPASHSYFCPSESDDEVKKRCIVESMEINIANLFHTKEIRGLYPSDVPTSMIREKGLEQVYLWHAHYPFWKNVLVEKLNFPAMKISNDIFVTRVKNRAQIMFKKCTRYMKPPLFYEMYERLLEEPDNSIFDLMK